ncbi:MAG: hypothetical protein ACYCOU_07850 [Sulfobacillus sp.]
MTVCLVGTRHIEPFEVDVVKWLKNNEEKIGAKILFEGANKRAYPNNILEDLELKEITMIIGFAIYQKHCHCRLAQKRAKSIAFNKELLDSYSRKYFDTFDEGTLRRASKHQRLVSLLKENVIPAEFRYLLEVSPRTFREEAMKLRNARIIDKIRKEIGNGENAVVIVGKNHLTIRSELVRAEEASMPSIAVFNVSSERDVSDFIEYVQTHFKHDSPPTFNGGT